MVALGIGHGGMPSMRAHVGDGALLAAQDHGIEEGAVVEGAPSGHIAGGD